MEVKQSLLSLAKKDAPNTRTFIINLAIGLIAFGIFTGITTIASAQGAAEEPVENADEETSLIILEEATTTESESENASPESTPMPSDPVSVPVVEQETERRIEIIEEPKAALTVRTQNRILSLSQNITNKMGSANARMEQIIPRLESRIALLQSEGINTTAAEAKIAEAKSHLTNSATAQTLIVTKIDQTVSSEKPAEMWPETRVLFGEAKASLISAHQALREAVVLLKSEITTPPTDQ